MKEARYKHFGCADCYDAAIKFVNIVGKENLITITSNAYYSGLIEDEKYKYESRCVMQKTEKVTVWYWEKS